MQTITDLQQQKKNKQRYSVFLDGEYAFSVSDELVLKYGFHKGKTIEQQDLTVILQEDEAKSAFLKAVDYLGYGSRTVKQMREYLKKKEYSPESIDSAVEKLLGYNLLNDRQYAEDFIACKSDAALGRQAIKYKLMEKGVPKTIIEEALESFCHEEAQLEGARQWVRKYLPKYADLPPRERRSKLGDTLARRGFSWEIIKEAIAQEEVKDDD